MKSKHRKTASKVSILLGALMILAAAAFVLVDALSARSALRELKQTAEKIEELLPPRSGGFLDESVGNTMPVLDIFGRDYLGLLEAPGYSSALPVQNEWSSASLRRTPCRFSGRLCDGSLIIGGTDTAGQFDFITRIGLGDPVVLTDVRGAVYSFSVSSIRHPKALSSDVLTDTDGELVLFARRAFASDYVVVVCAIAG